MKQQKMKSQNEPQSSKVSKRHTTQVAGLETNSASCGASSMEAILDLEDCQIPYAKVEFVHPRSGKHEFVEFYPDGKLEGTEWVEREYKPASNLKYFLAGMLWTGAVWAILWVILNR